jgi:hypothetical protein
MLLCVFCWLGAVLTMSLIIHFLRSRTVWLCFIIGVSFGVLGSPLLIRAIGLMSAAMPTDHILLLAAWVNLLFIPSFIALSLVRKLAVVLVAQIGQGMGFALLTPYAVDALISCTLTGGMVMVMMWLIQRQRPLANSHLMFAGILIGFSSFVMNGIGHKLPLDFAMGISLLGISVFGMVTTVWMSNRLTAWLVRSDFVQAMLTTPE